MAWFQISCFSQCLSRTVPVNLLLPQLPGPAGPFRTVYVLNGYRGDQTDWLLNTPVNELSMKYSCAMVFPAGENSFYMDNRLSGVRFGEFIGRELVEFTRTAFPLSDKREDTAIAGLSMGGFGALRNGLKYTDTFGHIIALSSGALSNPVGGDNPRSAALFDAFGPGEEFDGSDGSVQHLAREIISAGTPAPDLYLACGVNDSLRPGNRALHAYLASIGFPHVYEEGPGTHEWPFWRKFLARGMARLGWAKPMDFVNPFYVDSDDTTFVPADLKEVR